MLRDLVCWLPIVLRVEDQLEPVAINAIVRQVWLAIVRAGSRRVYWIKA